MDTRISWVSLLASTRDKLSGVSRLSKNRPKKGKKQFRVISETKSWLISGLRNTVPRNVRRLGKTKNSPPLKLLYDHHCRYCGKIVPKVGASEMLTKTDIENAARASRSILRVITLNLHVKSRRGSSLVIHSNKIKLKRNRK